MRLTHSGNIFFPIDGHFVSQKQMRINEILQDYDPSLQLQWIPPNERQGESGPAFRVVHFKDGQAPYAVAFADECDERLLAKVFEADQVNNPNRLSFIDNYNNALEMTRAKEMEEQRQEDHEIAAAILRNNKSHYRHGGVDFERAGRRHSR